MHGNIMIFKDTNRGCRSQLTFLEGVYIDFLLGFEIGSELSNWKWTFWETITFLWRRDEHHLYSSRLFQDLDVKIMLEVCCSCLFHCNLVAEQLKFGVFTYVVLRALKVDAQNHRTHESLLWKRHKKSRRVVLGKRNKHDISSSLFRWELWPHNFRVTLSLSKTFAQIEPE